MRKRYGGIIELNARQQQIVGDFTDVEIVKCFVDVSDGDQTFVLPDAKNVFYLISLARVDLDVTKSANFKSSVPGQQIQFNDIFSLPVGDGVMISSDLKNFYFT